MANFWDNITSSPTPTPQPSAPVQSAPVKTTSNFWDNVSTTPVVQPKVAAPITPKTPSYFATTTPNGSFGPSNDLDVSGKPFLDYRQPGDTSTTTDKTRVDTTFDPTVAQKVSKADRYTPRDVQGESNQRIIQDAGPDDQIDHRMALAIAGSNDPSNLKKIPAVENQADGTFEYDLAKQVSDGKLSLFDAQKLEAANKKLPTPFTGAQAPTFWDNVTHVLGQIGNGVKDLVLPKIANADTTSNKGNFWDSVSIPQVPNSPLKPNNDSQPSGFKIPFDNTTDSSTPIKTGPSAPVRLPYSTKEVQIPGGDIISAGADAAARLTELPGKVITRAIQNFSTAITGKTTSLPYDTNRVGIKPGSNSGTDYVNDPDVNKFIDDPSAKNLPGAVLGAFRTAAGDIFDAVATGDILKSATKPFMSTGLDESLAKLGFNKSADITTDSLKKSFTEKLQTIVTKHGGFIDGNNVRVPASAVSDLNELGSATNDIMTAMNGKGVPRLNTFGKILQGTADVLNKDLFSDSTKGAPWWSKETPEKIPPKELGQSTMSDAEARTNINNKLTNLQNMTKDEDFEPKTLYANPDTKELLPQQADHMVNDMSHELEARQPGLSTGLKQLGNTGLTAEKIHETATNLLDTAKSPTLSPTTAQAEKPIIKAPQEGRGVVPYKDDDTLSTSILSKLNGRTTVSSQFISDLSKGAEVKGPEKSIMQQILNEYPAGKSIPVKEFADKVKAELLPLERTNLNPKNAGGQYGTIALPPEQRGTIEKYQENAYQSPIKTSAGDIHFRGIEPTGSFGNTKSVNKVPNYFGHTRVEDVPGNTRRVIEVQSDLYQKGNLDKELSDKNMQYSGKPFDPVDMAKNEAKFQAKSQEIAKLKQYNDPTAHFRMVREEIKQAAFDGKTKLQFPTGDTAMKIEGLGPRNDTWHLSESNGKPLGEARYDKLNTENLKEGIGIVDPSRNEWIITDVLGDGKFKATHKMGYALEKNGEYIVWKDNEPETGFKTESEARAFVDDPKNYQNDRDSESFDISGKVDTNNPIHKFYDKTLGKYLKNNYGATTITDKQGVTWNEIDVPKEAANKPVTAFKYHSLGTGPKATNNELESLIKAKLPAGTDVKIIFNPDLVKEKGVSGLFKKWEDVLTGEVKHAIELYTTGGKSAVRVGFHEAEHLIENLMPKALVDEMNKQTLAVMTPGDKKYYATRGYSTPEEQAAEFRADEAGKKNADEAGYKSRIQRVLDKIRAFVNKIVKAAKSVYEHIQSIPNKQGGFAKNPLADGEEEAKSVDEVLKDSSGEKDIESAKNSHLERIRNADIKSASDLSRKSFYESKKTELLNKKIGSLPTKPEGIIKKLGRALNPIKHEDVETQDIYKHYVADNLVAKFMADQELDKFDLPNKNDMQSIYDYQSGKESPFNTQVKKIFDNFYKEANNRGFNFAYRERYLPGVYANKPQDFLDLAAKYLKDKGMSESMIKDYLNGKQIPAAVARGLKISPTFEKAKIFSDYKTAESYGLIPKYKNIPALAAYWREQLERSAAGQNFITRLADAGKITPIDNAPRGWKVLDTPFSPKLYAAPPTLSHMINGLFRDEANLTIGPYSIKIAAKISRIAQEVVLSSGIPFTDIHLFSIGQAIASVTRAIGSAAMLKPAQAASELKVAWGVLRANINGPSLNFFEKNKEYIGKMAEEGINLGGRIGTYQKKYENIANNKMWDKVIGAGKHLFHKVFTEKTFGSMLPQLQVQLFKDTYESAIKSGLPEGYAQKFAAETVRASFGLMENVGRSPAVEDLISSIFFAPKFRESLIKVWANAGKSFTTEFSNPAYSRNKALVVGAVLTFAIYQYLNKKYSNQYTWQNENGHEFDLRIERDNGDIVYVPFMPSMLAFPRAIGTGAIALAKGDFKTAEEKFGTLLSVIPKTTFDILANQDYFGQPIFKDTDTGLQKAEKIAAYFGLSISHPYLKAIVEQIQNKKPLYQSLSTALQLPATFSSLTKIQQQQFYDAVQNQQKQHSLDIENFKPTYDKIRGLVTAGKNDEAQSMLDKLSDDDYSLYKSILTTDNRKKTINSQINMVDEVNKVQDLIKAGKNNEAQAIIDKMTDEEYKSYQSAKKRLGIK